MKNTLLFAFFFLVTSLLPSYTYTKILCESQCRHNQGYPLERHELLSAYSPSARFQTSCPWNLFVQADYLYWQPQETGLELAKDASSSPTEFVDLNFKYSSSFKTSLGGHLTPDDWLFSIQYTRFHKSTSQSISSSLNNSLYPIWFGNSLTNPAISHAFAKWKLHLNLFDFVLKRAGYIGKTFVFSPLAGMKLAWLDQNYAPSYTFIASGNVVNSFNKSNSWIVGPQAGLCSKILLGSHFHLFNDFAASVCYQRYRVKAKQQNPETPAQLAFRIHEKDSKLTPTTEMLTGLGLDLFAPKQRWHLSASVGYEVHVIWDQNLMRALVENTKSQVSRSYDNLYLHGITARTSLDF